jgi:hypothetical protein
MANTVDLTGVKHNRLTAIKRVANSRHGKVMWEFECECGGTVCTIGSTVANGTVRSCGCLKSEAVIQRNKTHGLSRDPLYHVWGSAIARCSNSNTANYKRYGGRGILFDSEWKSDFMLFYTWSIENGYAKGLELDRIDNDGNYEPSNCRYITKLHNSWNRRGESNSTSKYKGVSWSTSHKRWRAQGTIDGKKVHIGLYDMEEDAARAYNEKVVSIHCEYGNLNKIK